MYKGKNRLQKITYLLTLGSSRYSQQFLYYLTKIQRYKFTSKKVDKINDSSVRQLSLKNIMICAHQRTSQEAFSRLFNYLNFTQILLTAPP